MNSKVIGLMGFEFYSANKGCEALAYSFLYILSNIYNNEKIKIYYFSGKAELGEVPRIFSKFDIHYVPLRRKNIFQINAKNKMKECQCIYDVTMGDSFSDIYSPSLCKLLIRYKKLAEKYCDKYVLLPQTYGPFYNEKILKSAINVIMKADLVMCRDSMSKQFLDKYCLNKEKIVMADLAFFLPKDDKISVRVSGMINIGLNVSGLLWNGGFTKNNQFRLRVDYQEYVKVIINYCLNNNYSLHLIPHVLKSDGFEEDDDYEVLKILKEQFPDVILAPRFRTPMEAKGYISQMDCFCGARMHATIAAFSEEVPTIPFAYSRKFQGLFDEYRYNYVIDGTKMSLTDSVNKTCSYINSFKDIKRVLSQNSYLIKEKSNTLFQKMSELL